MPVFLLVNRDSVRAGKSLPAISVVAADLSSVHLMKQNTNRNIFESESLDKKYRLGGMNVTEEQHLLFCSIGELQNQDPEPHHDEISL